MNNRSIIITRFTSLIASAVLSASALAADPDSNVEAARCMLCANSCPAAQRSLPNTMAAKLVSDTSRQSDPMLIARTILMGDREGVRIARSTSTPVSAPSPANPKPSDGMELARRMLGR